MCRGSSARKHMANKRLGSNDNRIEFLDLKGKKRQGRSDLAMSAAYPWVLPTGSIQGHAGSHCTDGNEETGIMERILGEIAEKWKTMGAEHLPRPRKQRGHLKDNPNYTKEDHPKKGKGIPTKRGDALHERTAGQGNGTMESQRELIQRRRRGGTIGKFE